MKVLFVLLLALIMTGCAGTPEKSFVYKLDGVGQVSCSRGEEKSALEQMMDALKSTKDTFGFLSKSDANKSEVETQTKKTDMLNDAFDVCKRMNGLK